MEHGARCTTQFEDHGRVMERREYRHLQKDNP
jgi:hypothetical protein